MSEPEPLSRSRRWIALALLAAAACLPRWQVPAAPILPDALFYQWAAGLGIPDSHLVFRGATLVPLWLASLLTPDPFAAAQLHGILITLLGLAALAFLARTLVLDSTTTAILLLFFAASVDAVVYSGWIPLTDLSFAVACVFAVAVFLRWSAGDASAAVTACALALPMLTRVTGVFLVAGLLLLPITQRVTSARIGLGLATMAAMVAGLAATGLALAGDLFWSFGALRDFAGYALGDPPRPKARAGSYVAEIAGDPILLALVLVCALRASGARSLRPAWMAAACILLGLEVLDTLSERLLVQRRRLLPVVLLLLPVFASAWTEALGRRVALGGAVAVYCAALFGSLPGAALGEALPDVLLRKLASLVIVAAAFSALVRPERRAWLAATSILVLTVQTGTELRERSSAIRPLGASMHRLADIAADDPECPHLVLAPADDANKQLRWLHQLMHGRCARIEEPATREALEAIDFEVAYSRLGSLPGGRPSDGAGAGTLPFGLRRFEREATHGARSR